MGDTPPPPTSPPPNTTTTINNDAQPEETTSTRGKNWEMDEDVTLLESVMEVGRGRWADVRDMCHAKHKCTTITDHSKFAKRVTDISDKKKSKYFKPYKRRTFTKPKNKSNEEVDRMEKEHALKENYNEKLHERIYAMLEKLREKEALLTTEHKEATDQVRKALNEKGKERKKTKDEHFQALKEQAEEERQEKKRVSAIIQATQTYLERSAAQEEKMLDLLGRLLELEAKKLM